MSVHSDKPSHAADSERLGTGAVRPGAITWRGWWRILVQVWRRWTGEGYALIAAGLAFRALMTVFPVMLIALTVLGWLFDSAEVLAATNELLRPLPDSARALLVDQFQALAGDNRVAMGVGLFLAAVIGLWSLSAGTAALMQAYHLIYRERDRRSLWRTRVVATVIGGILLGGWFVALAMVVVVPALLEVVAVPALADLGARIGRWLALAAFMMLLQDALARFAVDRQPPRWRWIHPGSLVAVAVWLLACGGLGLYAANAARLSVTYGGVAGIVVLLLWLYLSAAAILVGALVDSEAEFHTAADSTTGPERPLGQRGAVVADQRPPDLDPTTPSPEENPMPEADDQRSHDPAPTDASAATTVSCPHCGESNEILLADLAPDETALQGCQVCCREMQVTCQAAADGRRTVSVSAAT